MNLELDLQLALAKAGEHQEFNPYPRVSSLMTCAKRLTLERVLAAPGVGQQKPKGMSWQGALSARQGNWVEDGVVALLRNQGYTVRDQQRELYWPTKEEPMLSGHIDGIIEKQLGAITSEPHLFECKATSAYRYAQFWKNGLMEEPAYHAQVTLYMDLLRNEGEDIESALVVLVAKDPSSVGMQFRGKEVPPPIMVFEVPYDAVAARNYLNRAEWLGEMFRAGTLGPMERKPKMGNSGDWDCSERWCPVFKECNPLGRQL